MLQARMTKITNIRQPISRIGEPTIEDRFAFVVEIYSTRTGNIFGECTSPFTFEDRGEALTAALIAEARVLDTGALPNLTVNWKSW